jgi:hypothetical protein
VLIGGKGKPMNLTPLCAVERCGSSVGAKPTRQLAFQPEAIGAASMAT